VVIVPREPLAPGHYKVALKESDTLYQWSFTVAAPPPLRNRQLASRAIAPKRNQHRERRQRDRECASDREVVAAGAIHDRTEQRRTDHRPDSTAGVEHAERHAHPLRPEQMRDHGRRKRHVSAVARAHHQRERNHRRI